MKNKNNNEIKASKIDYQYCNATLPIAMVCVVHKNYLTVSVKTTAWVRVGGGRRRHARVGSLYRHRQIRYKL